MYISEQPCGIGVSICLPGAGGGGGHFEGPLLEVSDSNALAFHSGKLSDVLFLMCKLIMIVLSMMIVAIQLPSIVIILCFTFAGSLIANKIINYGRDLIIFP
jgi:hypothetical protein